MNLLEKIGVVPSAIFLFSFIAIIVSLFVLGSNSGYVTQEQRFSFGIASSNPIGIFTSPFFNDGHENLVNNLFYAGCLFVFSFFLGKFLPAFKSISVWYIAPVFLANLFVFLVTKDNVVGLSGFNFYIMGLLLVLIFSLFSKLEAKRVFFFALFVLIFGNSLLSLLEPADGFLPHLFGLLFGLIFGIVYLKSSSR